MTSQRILKLLALLSLIATGTAILTWHQTGEPPSLWLIRLAVGTLAFAFVLFVINQETRPRIMLQFLAALFAIMALFAFAADFSEARGTAAGFHSTSLLERMDDFAPSLLNSLQNAATRTLGEGAWDPLLTSFLSVPAYLVFMILGAVCGYAGRPRRDVQIFIN